MILATNYAYFLFYQSDHTLKYKYLFIGEVLHNIWNLNNNLRFEY